jgi:hypothetical protein
VNRLAACAADVPTLRIAAVVKNPFGQSHRNPERTWSLFAAPLYLTFHVMKHGGNGLTRGWRLQC